MFSTFTGKSRRPRNVNLSGRAVNPFSNTSWSPADASNATKTVTDAQVDREKRQAERQRLKAAGHIQRTWRGHRVRKDVASSHRASFDGLYTTNISPPSTERLHSAFNLLLAFFDLRRNDDLERLLLFVRDCEAFQIEQILPQNSHSSRMIRLIYILVAASSRAATEAPGNSQEPLEILRLASRLISAWPESLHVAVDGYYETLARVCQFQGSQKTLLPWVIEALLVPIQAAGTHDQDRILKTPTTAELEILAYRGLAFSFLTVQRLDLYETYVEDFAKHINLPKLCAAVLQAYSRKSKVTNDNLLWLLAHMIHLGSVTTDDLLGLEYIEALHAQLSTLSTEISNRIHQASDETSAAEHNTKSSKLQPLEPYVNEQLLSLVNNKGISRLLRHLSEDAASDSSPHARLGTSLLAGYTSTLLACFPTQADDIRMRLFLASIPSPEGEIPTIKYLWQDVRQSALFRKLATESEQPVSVLRNYVHGTFHLSRNSSEEQEWRVLLIFLELYIFVLRLSDDDDFFSATRPDVLLRNQPTSRIRASSLRLEDLKLLSTFLKNSCFAMHYKAREIESSPIGYEGAAASQPDAYLNPKTNTLEQSGSQSRLDPAVSTRLNLNGLRDLMTTALKMLYERDSRKQFLPSGHWLSDKLEREDFISAVIVEYVRQRQEDDDGSDSDSDEDLDDRLGSSRHGYGSAATYARMERIRLLQKRSQRQRRLAELGPKLEILKHMPFVVPFETRVNIFRNFIELDREERERQPGDSGMRMTPFGPIFPMSKHHANIQRGQLFKDAYENFFKIGDGLKDTISITFVDQFGKAEAGIDGGGVTKEFLTSVTTEAFSPIEGQRPMFTSSEQGLLFPDPTAVDGLREDMRRSGLSDMDSEWRENISNLLKHYEFLGRIVGKCLYEGILLDISFAGFFLLQWSSSGSGESNTYKGSVNDLRDMDEELYNGMLRLKNYSGDVSELQIDFTINDQVSLPGEPLKTVTRNLIPNGDKTIVTNDNRLLYISYVARHRLVVQSALQTSAFLRGLRQIIRPSWLSMFNQSELQRLVGGDSSEIDVEDLQQNTVYGGLYVIGDDNEEHPTIKLFWKVMRDFTDSQRRDVIKYVSSTPRAPLLGFSQLKPKFSIRDAGRDESRLPSTSTCVNLLKLPMYTTEAAMRDKLLYAVQSGAGFDLS